MTSHVGLAVPSQVQALMKKALADGKPARLASTRITIHPPTGTRATWRVTYYAPHRRELSGGSSEHSVWTAIQAAHHQSLAEHATGERHTIEAFIDAYLEHLTADGSPPKTIGNRRSDLNGLRAAAAGVPCRDLTVEHLRRAVQRCGSKSRGKFVRARILAAMSWGYRNDYFTAEQLQLLDRVEWTPPPGWTDPGSRNKQARRAGQDPNAVDRGDRPSPAELTAWGEAAQVHYVHGQGLIHTGAIVGLRYGELFAVTADSRVAAAGLGNLLDTARWEIAVRVKLEETGGHSTGLPKADKVRDVVIPRADLDPTGYDVRSWLAERAAAALAEQAAGANPLALIWPAPRGGWWWHSNFSRAVLDPAYDDLGWPLTEVRLTTGKVRRHRRFTLHSLRDAYACTAVDVWKYTEVQLLEQGGWENIDTVRRFYLGVNDATHESVRALMV
jgi:hypothetical protein